MIGTELSCAPFGIRETESSLRNGDRGYGRMTIVAQRDVERSLLSNSASFEKGEYRFIVAGRLAERPFEQPSVIVGPHSVNEV